MNRLSGMFATSMLITGVGASPESKAADPIDIVYYQPRLSDLHDPESLVVPEGVFTMVAEPDQPNSWTVGAGICRPENADNFIEAGVEPEVLAGFSLGRVGIFYFLQVAPESLQDEVDTLVIFAPGNEFDFTDSCDPANSGELIRSWLERDKSHQITMITDGRSAEVNYQGIRELYLEDLANTALSDQVLICAAEEASHEGAWITTKEAVLAGDPRSCPPNSTELTIS